MATPKFFPLRDKLLLAVTLLVVSLTGSVLFILNARLKSESLGALDSDLKRTLSVFNSFVDERTDNLAAKGYLISGLPRLTAALDVRRPNFETLRGTVAELCLDLNQVARTPLFIVTDKSGRILFDSHQVPEAILALREGRDPDPAKKLQPPPVSTDRWPSVKAALSGQFSRGGLLYPGTLPDGKVQDMAFQTVTFPIASRGNILGVLILGAALDKGLAAGMKRMTESEIAFDVNQRIFASTWEDGEYPLVAQSLNSIAPSAADWAEKKILPPIQVKLDGENYLCLFAPFKDTQGGVLGNYAILRSLDKALALQRNIQRSIVIIGLLGVAFAFAIALFISQRITAPLNSLLSGVQEVGRGNLRAKVPILTHDEIGVLAKSFNEMITGLREKERVTGILGKYVSPEVAKKILAADEGTILKGERRECVVMFTDIRGFTALSEKAEPEALVADLNEYFSLMVDVVLKYEGTLDKFIGDAVMAVWGAPVPFEDKEWRSVQCALDMRKALQELNLSRVEKNRVPLTMGIGLNTGIVVSGNLGSDKRTDYTVIGEEVNLASRICSKAAPGQILVSESMYERLKDKVEMKSFEAVTLKGFSEPVRLYEVKTV